MSFPPFPYPPPPNVGNPYANTSYFYANSTFVLGSASKPVNSIRQITIDYSLTSNMFANPPIFSFTIDKGGGPPLVISNPIWNNSTSILTFLTSRGIPGVAYTITVNIQHNSGQVRSDSLTLEVTPAGNETSTPGVTPLPVGGSFSFIPPIFPIPPTGNNPIMIGSNLAFLNTGPRFFVGSQTPQGPNVMDYWYNPVTMIISVFVTDGSNVWWLALAESTAPTESIFVSMEAITIATLNTFPLLSKSFAPGGFFMLIVNGRTFTPVGSSPPFTVSNNQITWLSTIYAITPGDNVVAIYEYKV